MTREPDCDKIKTGFTQPADLQAESMRRKEKADLQAESMRRKEKADKPGDRIEAL